MSKSLTVSALIGALGAAGCTSQAEYLASKQPAPRRCTSVPPSLRGSNGATGSRLCPVKVSSRSCGSTTVYFGPTQPAGVKRGNWIQTMPGKGWFTLLRLYSPLESFFTKEWRPSEIELVK